MRKNWRTGLPKVAASLWAKQVHRKDVLKGHSSQNYNQKWITYALSSRWAVSGWSSLQVEAFIVADGDSGLFCHWIDAGGLSKNTHTPLDCSWNGCGGWTAPSFPYNLQAHWEKQYNRTGIKCISMHWWNNIALHWNEIYCKITGNGFWWGKACCSDRWWGMRLPPMACRTSTQWIRFSMLFSDCFSIQLGCMLGHGKVPASQAVDVMYCLLRYHSHFTLQL